MKRLQNGPHDLISGSLLTRYLAKNVFFKRNVTLPCTRFFVGEGSLCAPFLLLLLLLLLLPLLSLLPSFFFPCLGSLGAVTPVKQGHIKKIVLQ